MNMFTGMGSWCSALHEVNLLSIVLRIGMALVMGGILGAERGLRNRPAGFMTYVLVCMGYQAIWFYAKKTLKKKVSFHQK